MLQRPAHHGRRERRVDDEQRAPFAGDLGEPLDVGNGGRRVGDRLRVDDPGRRPGDGAYRAEVGDVHEIRLDAEPGHDVAQQAVRAAVERRGRHDVPARPREGEEHAGDRGHPRGERLGGGPARQVSPLKRGDRAGEGVDRGIVDPAVDISGHLLADYGRVLLRRGELERRGAVNGRGDGPLGGLRRWRQVHRPGVFPELPSGYLHGQDSIPPGNVPVLAVTQIRTTPAWPSVRPGRPPRPRPTAGR